MSQGAFLGRQPIVDRDQHVVAYELLYRSSRTATFAEIDDVGKAVLRVVVNTFASLGMEAVLGRGQGFFNVNREVFLSDAVEALPRDRVVIELLENVEPDDPVIRRCRALHEAGFQLALDDWVDDDARLPLLPWVDVVKVDLPAVPPKQLRKVVRTVRRYDALLLAEKVETREEFETCLRMGFDRFQGYFFAKPIVLEGADVDPAQAVLVRLMQKISAEAEPREIVESFKQDAKLGLNLLRLVNTAGKATRVALETIEAAVQHIGLEQLGRWVVILLFAQGGASGMHSPLLVTAAHRGRLMELIAGRGAGSAEVGIEGQRAFLVGMLSLADALLGRRLGDLVRELRVSDEVSRALTHHEGPLGELLSLAEAVERNEVQKFEPELDRFGLGLDSLQELDNDSYEWLHGLQQSGDQAGAS